MLRGTGATYAAQRRVYRYSGGSLTCAAVRNRMLTGNLATDGNRPSHCQHVALIRPRLQTVTSCCMTSQDGAAGKTRTVTTTGLSRAVVRLCICWLGTVAVTSASACPIAKG